jgi:hypothetical protein
MINGKEFGRKRSLPNSRHYTGIHLGLKKTTKNLNHHSRSPGPRFEPGTSQIRSRSVNHSTTTLGTILGFHCGLMGSCAVIYVPEDDSLEKVSDPSSVLMQN